MIRNRATALVAALMATALAVTACGKSSDTGSGSDTGTPETTTAATSTAAATGQPSDSGAPPASSGSGSGAPSNSGGSTPAGGSIVIGSANFAESELLMNIYAEALKAKGVQVTTKPKIGAREVYVPALKDGSIDLVPDYTGNLLAYLDAKTKLTSSEEVYAALPAALGSDLKVLDQSAAQDKDTYVVTKATADKYQLKTIADLAPHSKDMIIGAAAEFQTRAYGIPGLKSIYGVEFGKFQPTDPGGPLSLNALKNNQVDVTDLFSTDPAIKANGFVMLEDPKNMIAAQNVVPLINAKKSTPAIDAALNAVSAKLTTENLTELDQKVGAGGDSVQVAQEWVKAQGLG